MASAGSDNDMPVLSYPSTLYLLLVSLHHVTEGLSQSATGIHLCYEMMEDPVQERPGSVKNIDIHAEPGNMADLINMLSGHAADKHIDESFAIDLDQLVLPTGFVALDAFAYDKEAAHDWKRVQRHVTRFCRQVTSTVVGRGPRLGDYFRA